MRKHWMISMAVALALLLPATVGLRISWAQIEPPVPPPDPMVVLRLLAEADANSDGAVTLDEATALDPAITMELFGRLDRNHDGMLTRDDLPAPLPPELVAKLQELLDNAAVDANQDGAISLEEARAVMADLTAPLFRRLDRNGDKVLTRDDLMAAPAPPRLPDVMSMLIKLVKNADADHDGQITRAEIVAFIQAHGDPNFVLPEDLFNVLDRNKDGVLSEADLPPPPDPNDPNHGLPPVPGDPEGLLAWLLQVGDTNGDGKISLDEALALKPGAGNIFMQLDTNQDGFLDGHDLRAFSIFPVPSIAKMVKDYWRNLSRLDINPQDGQLDLAEIRAFDPNFPVAVFKYLDTNADGFLSLDDLPAGPPPGPRELLRRMVNLLDVDGDGGLSIDELRALVPILQQQFDGLDRNHDGILNVMDLPPFLDDAVEIILGILRDADANQDGQVDFDELVALYPGLTQEQFNLFDRNNDGVINAEDRLVRPLRIRIKVLLALLRAADTDNNGIVTWDELAALVPDLTQDEFNFLDRNGDGVITRDDLPRRIMEARQFIRELLKQLAAVAQDGITLEELQTIMPNFPPDEFARLDLNADGVLTLDDIPESPLPRPNGMRRDLIRDLLAADTNQDGVLDQDEIAAAFPDAPAELIAKLDINGDWLITRQEILDALGHGVDGVSVVVDPEDMNGDGRVDALDIQITINFLLHRPGILLPPDVNGDGVIDAVDIQAVISRLLDNMPPPPQ